MGTIANAKVTHYYNCYNGYFVGCLPSFDWKDEDNDGYDDRDDGFWNEREF